jgi:hypothetical protein
MNIVDRLKAIEPIYPSISSGAIAEIKRLRARVGTLTRHTPSRHNHPAQSLKKSKKPR